MTRNLSYVIVDDDELSRISIQACAARYPFFSVGHSFANPIEAAEFINQFKPDVLFTDIEMPGISGLQLVRRLQWRTPAPVFITTHPEFALDGYELEAFDFLLKPVNQERFHRCALRLQNFFTLRSKAGVFDARQESGSIVIKEGYEKYKIQLADIHYIEAMKDYIRIITSSKQYLVLETLVHFQERLQGAPFVRIHRSYLVNQQKITATMANKIVVAGVELPVGKSYKNSVNAIL